MVRMTEGEGPGCRLSAEFGSWWGHEKKGRGHSEEAAGAGGTVDARQINAAQHRNLANQEIASTRN